MFLRKSIPQLSSDISKNYKSEVTALVKFHKSMADTAKMSLVYFMVLLLIQCSIGLIDLTYLITTVLSFAGIGYMTLHLPVMNLTLILLVVVIVQPVVSWNLN